MKQSCSSLFLFLVLFILSSCAQNEKKIIRDIASLQAAGGVEGVWFLQGTSSARGPYNGELELRRGFDGTYEVVRIVTYINYFFDGLKVQEVWTGKAVPNNNSIVITYDLQQADFITQLGSEKRNLGGFNNPMTVNVLFKESPRGLAAQFDDGKSSKYSEWLTTQRKLDEQPLWVDQKKYLDARGGAIPSAVKKNIESFKKDFGFTKSEFWKAHKKCSIDSSAGLAITFDPTDFDFYRRNNDIIRVVNKITDTISISEAAVKRNAYAPLLQQKASGFDGAIQTSHRDKLGRVQGSGGGLDENEISFLTGIYLSSQAMRYLATKEPEVLKNVRVSLSGLLHSIENAKKNSSDFQINSKGIGGILHGIAWTTMVLPKTELNLRDDLRSAAMDVLQMAEKSGDNNTHTTALAVASLLSGDGKLQQLYQTRYAQPAENKKLNFSDSPFYWQGSADWIAAQNRMFNYATEIIVTEALGMDKVRDSLRSQLMEEWSIYAPAQRGLMTLIAYGFAYKDGVRTEGGASAKSLSERFSAAVSQAVWDLREIPFPRPQQVVQIDHSLNSRWCVSSIPSAFLNIKKNKKGTFTNMYQGGFSVPFFELSAFSSNFIWEDSPFLYSTENVKGQESPGVDYLYAYWLGRYAGVSYEE